MSALVAEEKGKCAKSKGLCPVRGEGGHVRLVGQGSPSLCPFPT